MKISRLETRFQEVVFILTMTFALSITVGGWFYLSLSPQNFFSAAGILGSKFIASGFSSFGYTYFAFVLFLLHMGHLTLATAYRIPDLAQSFPVYFRSGLVYFTMLLLSSSFLSILQAYNAWIPGELLPFGYGGWYGSLIGGFLYRSFGLYGSMVIIFTCCMVIGISAGYMEIVHSFYVMKDILTEVFHKLHHFLKGLIGATIQWVVNVAEQKPNYAISMPSFGGFQRSSEPFAASDELTSPYNLYRSGRISTDDFHRYTAPEPQMPQVPVPPPIPVVEEKVEPELPKPAEPKAKTPRQKKQPPSATKTEAEDIAEDSKTASEPAQPERLAVKAYTKRYKKLETTLLTKPAKKIVLNKTEIDEVCKLLNERLDSFGIKGNVIKAHQGVTLTMFEFQPDAGMKLSKIQSLSDDLALVLGAKSIRILTPIPGKTTVGIEVPNKEISMLRFSEMVNQCLKEKNMELPVPLGLDVYNRSAMSDLAKMPHLLVSGTTGSGKSVFMNSLISGLIFHKSPKELRFLMVDPKMIELSPYNGIPHLLKPVITDVEEAKDILIWAEKEMDLRYKMFTDMQTKNITSFNQAIKKGSKRAIEGRLGKKLDWSFDEMPYIVIVIDELADLMLTQRQEVEKPITRIAQKARAAGIHMVMATQRPSSDIVTGLIKTNFPTRISFKVSSGIDSRTILDQPGAEKLLGNGDMLFLAQGKPLERLQGAYLSEEEVKKIVKAASSQAASK